MLRTQISLTEEQMMRLREEAARRGVSVASVVRTAVDAELARTRTDERVELAREVVGTYRSGRSDVGREHDAHLVLALEDDAGERG